MSSFDMFLPKENLIEPFKYSSGTLIACKTWDFSATPDVQAEPIETAMPSKTMGGGGFWFVKNGQIVLRLSKNGQWATDIVRIWQ